LKKRKQCVLSKFSIVGISVGLLVAVNNPQFRVIERVYVEGNNKRSDRGHSSND